MTEAVSSAKSGSEGGRRHIGKHSGKSNTGGGGGSNGFKALNLSDEVYKGVVRMGFRVSQCELLYP